MSYSKKRIDYNNNWPNKNIEFQAEQDFKNALNDKGLNQIFKPIYLPLIDDFQFQRLLSFKIDIYEQLPLRPDIAFDLAWRTFEAYTSYFAKTNNWTVNKSWKILNKSCEDIFKNQINNDNTLQAVFEELTNIIPLQASEFLIKRIFETTSNAIKSQQTQIVERVKDFLGNDLYSAIETKYGGANFNAENQRKASLLLKIIITGSEVDVSGQKFKLDIEKRMKLIINGLLYTYRNERFHGDAFSPFKSSKTDMKTYSVSYYYLIATYFFIACLIYKNHETLMNINDISEKLDDNNNRFKLIFEKYLKK